MHSFLLWMSHIRIGQDSAKCRLFQGKFLLQLICHLSASDFDFYVDNNGRLHFIVGLA